MYTYLLHYASLSVILLEISLLLIIDHMHTAPTQESSNQAVVIISSSVTVITLIVLSIIVIIVTIVIVKRCGRSKVVLQVTGDSMDIVGDPSLPSVLIHKWVVINKISCLGDFPYNCKSHVIVFIL